MSPYLSRLTVLEHSASSYPDAPVFRVPRSDLLTGQVHDWSSYPDAPVFRVPRSDLLTGQVHDLSSYPGAPVFRVPQSDLLTGQFKHDVKFTARYWRQVLESDSVSENSVVGLWLPGMAYQDVLHIYGLFASWIYVSSWMGSMCYIAQTFMLIGALQHRSCVIQPTKIAFSSEQLINMIHRCQLNCLNQFSMFLSIHLRDSQQNRKLLGYLQSLDQILLSRLSLPREDEDWAYKNGLHLKNLFGSTARRIDEAHHIKNVDCIDGTESK
ncbi:hypothetical protein F4604DRAFT_1937224 [Suillus subluteus]|nr:hypothetical protein F4604DRAFT_1937224 [Suillus subluteus]